MSWHLIGARPNHGRIETPNPLRFMKPDTGEIRELEGGFDRLIELYDEAWDALGAVAEALGPDTLRRWEDGKIEPSALAREVAALRGTLDGYRRVLAGLHFVLQPCKHGDRVSTCYHVPRCKHWPGYGFGRLVVSPPEETNR